MARFMTIAGRGASVYLLALLVASITPAVKSAKVDAFFQHSCSSASVCDQLCVDLPERSGHTCACKPGYQLHANGFSCVEVAIAPAPASTETPLSDVVDAEEKQLEDAQNAVDGESESNEKTSDVTNSSEENEAEGNVGDLEKALSELGNSDHVMMGDQPMEEESSLQQTDDGSDNNDDDDNDFEMVGAPGIETEEIENNMSKRSHNDRYRGRQKGRNRGKGRRKGGRKGGKGRQKGKGRGNARQPYPYQADGFPGVKVNTALTDETDEESKSTSKYRSCDQLRCMGGGRCIEDRMRGGVRCQCKLGTDGTFCEKDVMVKFPKFIGTGYLAFPVLRGAYKEFTIKIEFRPDTHNGLLMFTGEYSNAQLDFFSITLVDGHAQFRFDCGSGLAEITTDNMVALGEWNTLTIHRSGWNGWIQLNDGPQLSGRSKGVLTRITFRQDLYLGGYRNTSLIGRRTGMKWGFVGCVRSLIVNNKHLDMRKGTFVGDAIRGVDVTECSSHICDSVTCQNGGTCVADSADTSVCLCPLGTAGDACEAKVDIYVPSFNGASYLQFIGLRRTVLSYAEVEMVFKPMDKDGMLFYNGYTTDRTGDFISLGLVDGYVEFRFDLGTGPAVIRSRRRVSMNEWHVVRFSRTGRDGYLQVDNNAAVEGMAKGAYNQLTLTLDLFIGGHRNFDEVAKNARLTKAFKGCIQKVVINEKPVKLLDDALTGVNIDNCNHPCAGQPCLNGGRCLPMKDTYKCSCPIGFDNTNCEDRIARYRYRYRFRRELRSVIEVPMFTGQSYLKYTNPYMLQRIKGSANDLLLKVRVTKPNGVIFWAGEKDMTTMGDYLAVGLSDGFIHLRYNLGSGEVIISYNGSKVNDRRWHRIHIRRDERVGSLEVDGMTLVEGKSPGPLKQLNTGDEIYIGGLPDVVHGSMKKYDSGFIGCIAEVTMGTDYRVDLIGEASDGQNVLPCSPA